MREHFLIQQVRGGEGAHAGGFDLLAGGQENRRLQGGCVQASLWGCRVEEWGCSAGEGEGHGLRGLGAHVHHESARGFSVARGVEEAFWGYRQEDEYNKVGFLC